MQTHPQTHKHTHTHTHTRTQTRTYKHRDFDEYSIVVFSKNATIIKISKVILFKQSVEFGERNKIMFVTFKCQGLANCR